LPNEKPKKEVVAPEQNLSGLPVRAEFAEGDQKVSGVDDMMDDDEIISDDEEDEEGEMEAGDNDVEDDDDGQEEDAEEVDWEDVFKSAAEMTTKKKKQH